MNLLQDPPGGFDSVARAFAMARHIPSTNRLGLQVGLVCDGVLFAKGALDGYRQVAFFSEHMKELGYREHLLGSDDASGISTGANVSVTNYALEALASEKPADAASARDLAKAWLVRGQKVTGDGGFTFTADAPNNNNKAQWTDKDHRQPRSYGSSMGSAAASS